MPFPDTTLGGAGREFPVTLTELLAGIQDPSEEARRRALEELCRGYWKPTYIYIRITWRKSNEEAKDLAQGFFLWILEGGALLKYEKERASFRTYLKLLLKHFVNRQDEAMERLKRGGGRSILPFDAEDASLSEILPDPASADPEQVFDRAWRRDHLDRALKRVQQRYLERGKAKQFQAFEEYDLRPDSDRPTYGVLAEKLGLKATDIHNCLMAIREEIRQEIRSELSRMSTNPDQFREEWKAFFEA